MATFLGDVQYTQNGDSYQPLFKQRWDRKWMEIIGGDDSCEDHEHEPDIIGHPYGYI